MSEHDVKHIFILNPAAGGGKGADILPAVMAALTGTDTDYEIHRTISIGDAGNFVRGRLADSGTGRIRFYACGGDGTVNEVLNGIMGNDNAEIAVVPTGTGNDFVRNFASPRDFLDISKQLASGARRIDALRYECFTEGVSMGSGYALNMFNLGFDANVVARAAELKHGIIKGTAAYIAGVMSCLVKLKTMDMRVRVDGADYADGVFLLAGAANGGYSGGGFHGLPPAMVDDGLMDLLLVRSVTRRFFISIVKKYHDGTHIGNKKLEGVLSNLQCHELEFSSEQQFTLAIDGETAYADRLVVSIVPNAVNFVVPEPTPAQ